MRDHEGVRKIKNSDLSKQLLVKSFFVFINFIDDCRNFERAATQIEREGGYGL